MNNRVLLCSILGSYYIVYIPVVPIVGCYYIGIPGESYYIGIPGESHRQRTLGATVHGVAKSQTRLRD